MKKAFQLTSFLLLRLEEMQNFPEIWSQISTNVICLQIFRNCKKNDQNIHLNYKFPSKFHILSMHACYDLHNQVVFQIICPSPRNLKFSFVCLFVLCGMRAFPPMYITRYFLLFKEKRCFSIKKTHTFECFKILLLIEKWMLFTSKLCVFSLFSIKKRDYILAFRCSWYSEGVLLYVYMQVLY